MPDLVDRLYTPSDLPGLRRLWETAYEPESVKRREIAFRWVTEGNPICSKGAPRHLVIDGGRVAGSLGSLPVRCRASGKSFDLHFSHDLLVDRDYRGLGLGKRLVRRVAESAPSLAAGIWMTGPCYALHQRMGWKPVQPFRGHGLVLDPRTVLKRRIRSHLLVSLLSRPAKAYFRFVRRRLQSASIPVIEIDRFDARVDALFERCASSLGIVAERKASYLNWKYVESPNVNYRRFLIGEENSPDAWVVVLVQRRPDGYTNGIIVDFLADPARLSAFDSAVATAAAVSGSAGADILLCLATHPRFRGRLQELGFRQAPHLHTLVITGEKHLSPGLDPYHSRAWHLTYGDSDGYMWAESARPRDDG